MIQKFNLKALLPFMKTDCKIVIYEEGLSEEGEPLASLNLDLKCRFVEKTKFITTNDGKKVELVGKVILINDIAPNFKKISGGEVIINSIKFYIYQTSRPRNPDGTVMYTTLELM